MSATATITETPVFVPCAKCGGKGRIHAFAHIARGECFGCAGSGGQWSTVEREEKLALRREKDRARRAAKREAEALRRRQEAEVFISEHEGLAEALEVEHEISEDLKRSVLTFGSLSEAQVSLALKVAREAAEEEKVEEVEVVEGRGEVTGEITSIKWVDNFYSPYGESVCKIVVTDDRGFRLYGTAPKAIREEAAKGARISFTATLTAKEPGFGLFSRPVKAQVL